jgi:hypothetical protein
MNKRIQLVATVGAAASALKRVPVGSLSGMLCIADSFYVSPFFLLHLTPPKVWVKIYVQHH